MKHLLLVAATLILLSTGPYAKAQQDHDNHHHAQHHAAHSSFSKEHLWHMVIFGSGFAIIIGWLIYDAVKSHKPKKQGTEMEGSVPKE